MNDRSETAVTEGEQPVYVWASVGSPSEVPSRIRVESCTSCAALVPVATFDRHGLFHRELERLAGVVKALDHT